MIARISGELIMKQPPLLLLDVHGVGYEMQAPMSTFCHLPEAGRTVTLLTHFVVRQDAQVLYAFLSEYERSLFREMLKVSGIGAKTALAILSGMDVGAFRECVVAQDAAALARLPGIGRKTAERLLVEMKNRLEGNFWQKLSPPLQDKAYTGHTHEAVQGLVSLGYKPAEAKRLIRQVVNASDYQVDVATTIRNALKVSLRQER